MERVKADAKNGATTRAPRCTFQYHEVDTTLLIKWFENDIQNRYMPE